MAKTKRDPSTLPVLDTFEDKPVVGVTVALTGAGDGLSPAMAIDPRLMQQGEIVYVLTEAHCSNVQFPALDDDGRYLTRKQILVAQTMTIIDESVARKHIAAQKKKNLEAELKRQEEEEGKMTLVDADDQAKDGLAE